MINFPIGKNELRRNVISKKTWLKDSLFLLFIIGLLFFTLLGSRPLFTPDEGRYAEIAREMVSSGNYITPYLNHIKYFEKPILFYWLGAFALKMGGIQLWSIRAVNAILALIGILATYASARKLYNRRTGLLAAFILSTSLLYFTMARMVSLDLPVTVFLSLSLYGFLLGTQAQTAASRRFYSWGAASASALAVLTKGLIGIVFPALIVFAWLFCTGEWRVLKRLYLPSSIFIFLCIATPWHVLVNYYNPEFFHFYFIEQHFLRYTTLNIGHYQPAWFFIPTLILGFFPWILFLPSAFYHNFSLKYLRERAYKINLFFILWTSIIFIFFSFSKSKLIPYILPIFPPLAILTAHYFDIAIQTKKYREIKIAYVGLFIFSILIAVSLIYFSLVTHLPDARKATLYFSLASLILIMGMGIGLYFSFKEAIGKTLIATLITIILFLLSLQLTIPVIETRTILPLATLIKLQIKPQDEVITYNQYYQDLPFYLERRVSILNWQNELSFGMKHQNTSAWMINDDTFWRRWHSNKRLFVVMSVTEYQTLQSLFPQEKIYLLGKTLTNILVSNQP